MFTGLVETLGRLVARSARGPGFALEVQTDLEVKLGDSVAVNGACLTVTRFDKAGFSADVSKETASKTTLGGLALRSPVNLERAVRPSDRLGGHMMTGHVDGIGKVVSLAVVGDAQVVRIEFPKELAPFVASKGSISVDGISLTVNTVDSVGFSVALIPHTRAVTTSGVWVVGAAVNLEIDIVARYVVRYLETRPEAADARLRAVLSAQGWPIDSGST